MLIRLFSRSARFSIVATMVMSGLFFANPSVASANDLRQTGMVAPKTAALISKVRDEVSRNGGCNNTVSSRIHEVFCKGRIRIGVREYYPAFGTRDGQTRSGYDVDVGRHIAQVLGVKPEFQRVNAATRIAYANEGRIDLIAATMGHNTRREDHVNFVRPHYYQSETIIVGSKAASVKSFDDLKGQSVCVTIGNGSNVHMASQGLQIRLMKTGPEMIRGLENGLCKFAAQDSSYFAAFLAKPDFAARFDRKFGFSPVPWGIGYAKQDSDRLGDLVQAISKDFHRLGVFLRIAEANKIDVAFLQEERAKWRSSACRSGSDAAEGCFNQPLQSIKEPFAYAETGRSIEEGLSFLMGTKLTLPMLTDANAWRIFSVGVAYSLILVCSTIILTALAAISFAALLALRLPFVNSALQFVVLFFQSCPVVLLLVIASTIWISIFSADPMSLIIMAALALGTFNGSLAGKAIYEQFLIVEQSREAGGLSFAEKLVAAVLRSSTQITNWLVNGVKGTPIASFVGTPELLSALTEVTAFTGERVVTYLIALLFYLLIVGVVTVMLRWVERGFKDMEEVAYA